jgi:WD40 repeat protein
MITTYIPVLGYVRPTAEWACGVNAAAPAGLRPLAIVEALPPLRIVVHRLDRGGELSKVQVRAWEEVGASLETQLGGDVQEVLYQGSQVSRRCRWEDLGIVEGAAVTVDMDDSVRRVTGPSGCSSRPHGGSTPRSDTGIDPAEGCPNVIHAGHTGKVLCVCDIGDGRLASGARDATVRIWAAGQCQRVLQGHTEMVLSVAQVGGRLVSAAADRSVRVWALFHDQAEYGVGGVDGQLEMCLTGHTDRVMAVRGLGEGLDEWVASSSKDGTVRIWGLAGDCAGVCVRVLHGHTGGVWCVASLGDGRLASGGVDKTVRLWGHVASGASGPGGLLAKYMCVLTMVGHAHTVYAVAALPLGLLASASEDRTIRIWTKGGMCRRVLHGHRSTVRGLAYVGDGLLASASWDTTVRVWSISYGECDLVLQGHTAWVNDVALRRNGELVTGSDDGTVRTWHFRDPTAAEVECGESPTTALQRMRSAAKLHAAQLMGAAVRGARCRWELAASRRWVAALCIQRIWRVVSWRQAARQTALAHAAAGVVIEQVLGAVMRTSLAQLAKQEFADKARLDDSRSKLVKQAQARLDETLTAYSFLVIPAEDQAEYEAFCEDLISSFGCTQQDLTGRHMSTLVTEMFCGQEDIADCGLDEITQLLSQAKARDLGYNKHRGAFMALCDVASYAAVASSDAEVQGA